LVAYTKTSPREGPLYSFLVTHNPATATLQAALVGECDVVFPELETVCRAGICARVPFACPADIFFYLDMAFFIDIEFIYG